MKVIKIGATEYPYKFSKAALLSFQRETGKDLAKSADETTLQDMATLAYHALVHGCKAEGVEMKMTFDDFLVADTKYDIIDIMIASFGDDQKKQ